ncbi:hypothetical protein Tco_0811712, partial [Tanacetum coccineum]
TLRPPVGLVVELSPTSYLEPRANKHDLLRGGYSDSGISSLWSTGGGMYRDGGSCGSGGDGNAAVTALTRACVEAILSEAVHLAMRSPVEGGDSEIGDDGDGVGMARSLSTSASGGRDIEA